MAKRNTDGQGTSARTAQSLLRFLISLAVNPELRAAFDKDPGQSLKKAGIAGDAAAAVLSGSRVKVRKVLGDLDQPTRGVRYRRKPLDRLDQFPVLPKPDPGSKTGRKKR